MQLIFSLHLSLESSRDNFVIQSSCFSWSTRKSAVGYAPYDTLYRVHFTHALTSAKLGSQVSGFILTNVKVLKWS